MRTFTFFDEGFSVRLPESFLDWRVADPTYAITSGTEGAFRLQVGATDGSFPDCEPFGSPCRSVHLASVNDLAEVVADVQPSWAHAATSAVLDGTAAEQVTITPPRTMIGPAPVIYVLAIVNDRPYLLQYDGEPAVFPDILSSFRFLDTPSEPNPTPSSLPTLLPGMRLYRDATLGFEIAIREDWEPRELESHGEPAPGVAGFGFGRHSSYPAVTVSIGDASGRVFVCNGGLFCTEVRATSLEELAEAVGGAMPGLGRPPAGLAEMSEDITLDGEPARYEGYDSTVSYAWVPVPVFNHVLAFHQGRPVVIAFDYFSFPTPLSFNEQMHINSFRFLEEPASEPSANPDPSPISLRTQVFAEAGFAVDIPATWQARRAPDPAIVTVSGSEGGVTVRTSNTNDEIPTCLVLAPCQLVAAHSMDDLIGVARGEYRVRWGLEPTMGPTVRDQRVILDGVAAARVTISPPGVMTGPGTERYLVLIRNGRAVILQWEHVFSGAGLWDEILSSFRFVD